MRHVEQELARPSETSSERRAAAHRLGSPPVPADESGRLDALRRLLILDSTPEQDWDDLALLASEICGTPIALVSLVDEDRQWFKAQIGLEVSETPRDAAFCAHAITAAEPIFTVADATADPRFVDNPLVTGGPGIRFYAGAPIVTDDGHALGTVCVIDTEARILSESQKRCLEALARQAAGMANLRRRSVEAARTALEQAGMTAEARLKLEKGSELLDLVLQGRELGLWDLDVATGRWTASAYEVDLLGYGGHAAELADVPWRRLVHPDDQAATTATMGPHLRGEAPYYECTHRMRHRDGHWLWILSRAVVVERDASDLPLRIVGTHMDITEARREAFDRQRNAERLELALVGGDIGTWDVFVPTDEVVFNAQWARMLGYALDEVQERPGLWRDVIHPDDLDAFAAGMTALLRGDVAMLECEGRLLAKDGRSIWVMTRAKVIERDANGRASRLVGINLNITGRKEVEHALVDSERRLQNIADSMPACIAELDPEGRFRFANATYERWIGVDRRAMIGRHVEAAIGPEYYDDRRAYIARALAGETVTFEQTSRLRCGERTLQSTYLPHFDEAQRVAGFYALTNDITELKETQRKLDALARVDALTGLPNRRHFEERANDSLARARRTGRCGALLYLDVDHFKSVNDSLGHAGGDELLQEFARRLTHALRETDFVARYAGDEFIAIAEGVENQAEAVMLAHKITLAIRRPFILNQACVRVTTSIGVATFDGREPLDALLERADAALYDSKSAGRDAVQVSKVARAAA